MRVIRVLTLLSALGLAACVPEQTTWVDLNHGIVVTVQGTKLTYEDRARALVGTYEAFVHGDSLLVDEDAKGPAAGLFLTRQGDVMRDDGDLLFHQATPQQIVSLAPVFARLREAQRNRELPRPSLSGYEPIDRLQLAKAFASRAELSDQQLAERFVPGFVRNQDVFAEQDALRVQVPRLRAELVTWRDRHDFVLRLEDRSSFRDAFALGHSSFLEPYHFETHAFAFRNANTPCASDPAPEFAETHGYIFQPWNTQQIEAQCRFVVEDQVLARQIEAARAHGQLKAQFEVYVRITGGLRDVSNHNYADTKPKFMPALDVHAIRVRLFQTSDNATQWMLHPEGRPKDRLLAELTIMDSDDPG